MPTTPLAVSFYEVVLAVHIMAVVIAFGVTFAYPVMFAVAARHDPRALPLLHRIEYTIERVLVNPGLLLVLLAGIYLASKGHFWSDFFVQWGLGAAIVIGALVGSVMIPTAKRAEQVAARDLAAVGAGTVGAAAAGAGAAGASAAGAGTGASGAGASLGGEVTMSDEYRALVRRLTVVGSSLSALVLVTILFMALQLGS
ncbi:MAG TPA: hypothetical protein VMD79_15365 [Solirubrobacteraceae bacterium]|nr:hypothetical protein [Solirubrobacteraceae bacterium]